MNNTQIAIKVFSPPENNLIDFTDFPGGWKSISIPEFKISFSSSNTSLALPPPNKALNVLFNSLLILSNNSC